jgi:methylase of polypeptide subunit release factors
VEAQAALNRPAFVNELVPEWLPRVPDVAALLADSSRVTRVADVGCGLGWASIELVKAYPHLRVDGYDTDEESITRARRNAADAGVSERVTFDVVDASSPYGDGRYDLILFFECVHDMAHPVRPSPRPKRHWPKAGP